MKKIIFLIASFILSLTVFSQTEKGSWLAGGSLSYTSSSETMYGSKNLDRQFTITPQVGFFPVNNLAVIISASVYSDKYKNTMSSDWTTLKSHTVGPFLRYYISAGQNVKFFGGAGFGFGKTSGILDYSSHKITAWQFEAGPAFFISPGAALELTFNYQSTKYKGQESFNDSNEKSFGIGLGFTVYLHKRKK